jgi:hypothetical protein
MKTKTIKIYILDEDEMKTIYHCLGYCLHRIKEHNKIQAGNLDKMEKIRREIKYET